LWLLLEQEMGWQWHQLDHMQIVCTLLQTDNHATTLPLSFYRLDDLPAVQPTIKALKATFPENFMQIRLEVFVQSC